MTAAQFYVGIAVPSAIAFLAFMGVLLGFWLNSKQFSSLEKRMDRTDAKIDRYMDHLDAKLDAILEEQKKVATLAALHEYRLNNERPATAQPR